MLESLVHSSGRGVGVVGRYDSVVDLGDSRLPFRVSTRVYEVWEIDRGKVLLDRVSVLN